MPRRRENRRAGVDGPCSFAAPSGSPRAGDPRRSRAGSSTPSARRPARRAPGACHSMARRSRGAAPLPDRRVASSNSGMSPHTTVIAAQRPMRRRCRRDPARRPAARRPRRRRMPAPLGRPQRQQHAQRAAGDRDERAVQQSSWRRELPSAGAERDANRRLLRTSRRARQQERRDVGAGDEEHGGGRAPRAACRCASIPVATSGVMPV